MNSRFNQHGRVRWGESKVKRLTAQTPLEIQFARAVRVVIDERTMARKPSGVAVAGAAEKDLSPAGRPARVGGARSQRDWSLLRFGKARPLARLMLRRERALRKKELAAGKHAGAMRGRGVKRRSLRSEFDEAEEQREEGGGGKRREVEVEETGSMLSDASTESPSETPAWDTAAARARTPVRAARNPSPPWQGDACVAIDCEMVLPLALQAEKTRLLGLQATRPH